MENKPQSVFDKLDKQGEQIEDLSSKLEGVSVNDLYALAKRTWDYGDYVTAQKYYNHIGLLKPLEWKAPFMASLCNFRGRQKVDEIEDSLPSRVKLYVSTLEYVLNLDLCDENRNIELTNCVEIIKQSLENDLDVYYRNQQVFDTYGNNYLKNFQNLHLDLYDKIKNIDNTIVNQLKAYTIECCFDLIEKTNYATPRIDKIKFEEFCGIVTKKYNIDFDKVLATRKPIEDANNENISKEEKREILLKGTMYFEFKDKFVSRKLFIRNLVFGMIILLISLGGIIFSLFVKWYLLFAFVLPVFIGIVLIIKAFSQKKRIKCVSLLNCNREKNSLTSNGDIVKKSRTNVLSIISIIYISVGILGSVYAIVAVFNVNNGGNTVIPIVYMLLNIINYLCFVLSYKGLNYYYYSTDGYYTYLYNGKYYEF